METPWTYGRSDVRKVMVRYTVKADKAAENGGLIERGYEKLHATKPAGIRYATFALDDGVSFVHVASHETDDGGNPLMNVAAFSEFVKGIGERVESPPVTSELREIGSYGVWG